MTIPDYNVRYSKKAKRLQLRISRQGFEVVVPSKKRIVDHLILQFIQEKKAWITKRCVRALRQWLKKTAEYYLTQQLLIVSTETGLSFRKVSFRHNTSRWGSCSGQKHISLCCNLLFLPPHLVKHVLLHELCHTQYMHHGALFWRLLERYDSNMAIHKAELKTAGQQFVPGWVTYQDTGK